MQGLRKPTPRTRGGKAKSHRRSAEFRVGALAEAYRFESARRCLRRL